jgi:methylated-DNA-[protein]-cysteine S-methyltransferase
MSQEAGIYARESPYLDRSVQFGEAQTRVISVSFPRQPEGDADDEHPLLDRIEEYLRGSEEEFADVTVALTVPTQRRKVLETVREVPYGEQVSVAQLARMTPDMDPGSADDEDESGASEAVRTVREALADNPAPLLIPDHRVRDGPSGAPADVEQKLRSVEGL